MQQADAKSRGHDFQSHAHPPNHHGYHRYQCTVNKFDQADYNAGFQLIFLFIFVFILWMLLAPLNYAIDFQLIQPDVAIDFAIFTIWLETDGQMNQWMDRPIDRGLRSIWK